jgi:magnesium-transporting ATPase (P-type)
MSESMTSKESPPPQGTDKQKDRVCKAFTWNEIITGVIQFIGVIAAIVFGVWVIKSYEVAQRANDLSESGLRQTIIANQLAFLALCGSNGVFIFYFAVISRC